MACATRVTSNRSTADTGDDILRRAREKCDSLLHTAVESLPGPLATMAGYHFGWWDADRRSVLGTQGKSVRAALAYAAAAACGGSDEAAGPAAAAVELLHNFTLVHDDVMDGDRTRRGRATVWSLWGTNNAILLGDALHSLAVRLLGELAGESLARHAIDRLERACLELCMGQFEDCAFEGQTRVTVDDYVRMAGAKTARLMACACELGALSADADNETVAAMEKFGYEIGLAFQFVDDLIGIWGDPVRTGKPVGSDLVRRKATLPVVAALNSQCVAGIELGELYRSGSVMADSDVARATELIEAAGGRQAAERYAAERFASAVGVLPHVDRAADLITLSRMVVERSR